MRHWFCVIQHGKSFSVTEFIDDRGPTSTLDHLKDIFGNYEVLVNQSLGRVADYTVNNAITVDQSLSNVA